MTYPRKSSKKENSQQSQNRPNDRAVSGEFREKIRSIIKPDVPASSKPASPVKGTSQKGGVSDTSKGKGHAQVSSPRDGDDQGLKKRKLDDKATSRKYSYHNDGKGPWTFNHNKDVSIVDDPEGITHFFRHLKPSGWTWPSRDNMYRGEELSRGASLIAQGLAEYHKAMICYERNLRETPKKQEVEETAAAIEKIQRELTEATARVKALEKENEGLKIDLLTADRCRDEAELSNKVANGRIEELLREKQELHSQVQELKAEYEAKSRRDVRSAKRDLINAHYEVLEEIKVKFEAKEAEHAAALGVQDAESNVALLDEFFAKRISDLEAEYNRIKLEKLPKRRRKLAKRTVSDFSKSKYGLPQISDTSIAPAGTSKNLGQEPGVDPEDLGQHAAGTGPAGFEGTEAEEPRDDMDEDAAEDAANRDAVVDTATDQE